MMTNSPTKQTVMMKMVMLRLIVESDKLVAMKLKVMHTNNAYMIILVLKYLSKYFIASPPTTLAMERMKNR